MAMSFEPLAELFGVTLNVVVPVACGAIGAVVTGAKAVTQLAAPLPGTFAVNVNVLGAHPTGSLLSNVMVDVCATFGGPDVVVGLAVNVGIWVHVNRFDVTVVLPPRLVVIVISFEPLAEALGVTVRVVVPVAPPAATVMGLGAKDVAQFAGAGLGTDALKVKVRSAQPAGSLF